MTEILVIDDDLGPFKPGIEQALRGYKLHYACSGAEGFAVLERHPGIAAALLDVMMPPAFATVEEREGIEVLKRIKAAYPDLPVIMLTILTDVDLVVEAIQSGAFHYIPKPLDRDKLRGTVQRAVETSALRERIVAMRRARDVLLHVQGVDAQQRDVFHGMIGAHPLMQQLYEQIERAAPFEDMNIVFLGESGSGKDLAARALHACSPRRDGPFMAVNCAAFQETMLEAELFGHEKGAFTGAGERRDGHFQRAQGGTLFLDEIGEIPVNLQSKLLRAIEQKEVAPVGGAPISVDVRIVCATNCDLTSAKDRGGFRADLYYRIWDIPIVVPPLRRRKEDLPLLARHFIRAFEKTNGIAASIAPEALAVLAEYGWPGNVRELASILRRLAVFAPNGAITASAVRQVLRLPADASCHPTEPRGTLPIHAAAPEPDSCEYPVIEDLTEFRRVHGEARLREVIQRALREAGNARAAMALLGMPEDRYDAFRKCLQRLAIRVREIQDTGPGRP